MTGSSNKGLHLERSPSVGGGPDIFTATLGVLQCKLDDKEAGSQSVPC